MIGNDLSTFNSESIDGGSITAYDADGNPVNVEFRWAKVSSAATGGTDRGSCSIRPTATPPARKSPGRMPARRLPSMPTGEMSPPLSG